MKKFAAACLVASLIGGCSSAKHQAATPTPSSSLPRSAAPTTSVSPGGAIRPGNFVTGVDNPLFPLKPGSTYRYTGKKEDGPAVQTLEVVSGTKTILGVVCMSVVDSLQLNGRLEERVVHWYAQDAQGNVWYFGEADEQFDSKGKVVGHDGSWQAGLYGAQPGIVMVATPAVGAVYRQEYYKGHVEDQMEYVDLSVAVTVPSGSYANAVQTKETTRLEVGAVDYKYYAPGIGLVKERAGDGSEGFELTSYKTA